MSYETRLIREARAEAAGGLADAQFEERLLDALSGDRSVKNAVRALIPAPPKQPATRSSRR